MVRAFPVLAPKRLCSTLAITADVLLMLIYSKRYVNGAAPFLKLFSDISTSNFYSVDRLSRNHPASGSQIGKIYFALI
jgi:hypothetical protein